MGPGPLRLVSLYKGAMGMEADGPEEDSRMTQERRAQLRAKERRVSPASTEEAGA